MNPSASATETPTLRAILRRAGRAALANLVPGLLLQSVAVAILLGWSFWPAFRGALVAMADFKSQVGILFPICSTMLCGGVFPLILRRFSRDGRPAPSRAEWLFYSGFWAFKGAEVDLFYRAQSWMFGDGTDLLTLLYKVCMDQLVYCVIFAVPVTVLAYLWLEVSGSWAAVRKTLRGPWYLTLVLPVLIPNWLVWFPAVAIIYCLPLPLQVPMQNIILCMWVLLLGLISTKEQPSQAL